MHRILHAQTSPSAPNHPILPVILYKNIDADFKTLFKSNGWYNIWENGVFDYHHFHPDNHEVLGVQSGEAKLLIGGEHGQEVNVKKGDVILLPAGYGHKRLSQSGDFKVIGAYPTKNPVTTETSYDSLGEITSKINTVPLPSTDPVKGDTGPMFTEWHNIYQCNTVTGSKTNSSYGNKQS